MSETRNPPSLKSARKTSTPIRTQTTVTGCGILVYFVSNSGSSICDFRDAFGIDFAVDLLLNATRETECANRFMLRSNDFAALAYFLNIQPCSFSTYQVPLYHYRNTFRHSTTNPAIRTGERFFHSTQCVQPTALPSMCTSSSWEPV